MPVTGLVTGARGYGLFGASGPLPGFDSIATSTPSGVQTVTFSNIPQTYASLQLRIIARTSFAVPWGNLPLQFNNVTSASYVWHQVTGSGTSVSVGGGGGGIAILVGRYAGASASSNVFGVSVVDIHDYASTTRNKTVRSFNGVDNNEINASFLVGLNSGFLDSTNAVTSITIDAQTPFVSGSSIALYGIRGAA